MTGFLGRRVGDPLRLLLKQGLAPETLALSLALGATLGLFPVLGATTALCVAFAWPSPWSGAAIYCPLLMLFFLFRVTGIPATEEQAVRSRGDDYREYQRTTSAFFPWFPKKA